MAIAWTRQLNSGVEELVFISDSRYSGDGRNFDACPKIFPLPRSDCAISFAGYTGHALPMMLQLAQAIMSDDQVRRRSKDIGHLKAYALDVFDKMVEEITKSLGVPSAGDTDPDATFLFGGFSGRRKIFDLWTISYQKAFKRFGARPAPWLRYSAADKKFTLQSRRPDHASERFRRIAFAGDQAKNARTRFLRRLNHSDPKIQRLDWEPFETVRDMLREERRPESIGGAPQVVKVYQYMQADPIGVYWPKKDEGVRTLLGRNCLETEHLARWILDPDSLVTEKWPEAAVAEEGDLLNETE